MGKNFLFISGVVALSYIGGIFIAYKNLKKIQASYLPYEKGPEWLKICGPFMVQEELLLRKNDGDDPCRITKPILYIDYVSELDMFDQGV